MKNTENNMFKIFNKQIEIINERQKELEIPSDTNYEKNENYDYIKSENSNSLIINIHGGAFSSGDKSINSYYGSYLASKGYDVILLNYKYLPESNLINQIKEISASISSLSSKYDTDNLYLTADSSGAYIASIIAFIWSNKDFKKKYNIILPKIKLQAIGLTGCPWTYDIFPKLMIPYYKKMKELLLEGDIELAKDLDYNKLYNNIAPMFLMSCKGDMYYKKNIEFDKWLTQHNIIHKTSFINNEKLFHCSNVIRPDYESNKKQNDDMIDFFEKVK